MDGIILLNKEKNMTSRDCVNIASKILNTKKIGHTGTLDPLATGVLILCIGTATKLVEIITAHNKEYIAEITLGTLTDTLDNTGNILKEEMVNLTDEEIIKVINSFKKTYLQEVPIYSAVKINGKKLYEYARNNEEVILPKREVSINEIELISDIKRINNKIIFSIKTNVSKGTYIRSLILDIAKQLNTIGIMSDLTRTKQGDILLEECISLDDLKNNNIKIHKIDRFINNFKKVVVDDYLKQKVLNGQILENRENTDVLFIDENNNPLAIYKIYEKDNTRIKPWKMLK